MRYGRTRKIHIDKDDERDMIEDLHQLKPDGGELLKEIGYYNREAFSRYRTPATILSKLKLGKKWFLS